MTREIVFSPEALADLLSLYDYVADQSGESCAVAYITRIEAYCAGFAEFPERGMRRDELREGLRVVGFERRVTIAFHVEPDRVVFDRILYGGRNMEGAIAQPDRDMT
ncbi:type II toxin-antitoxin system RelE/ParE family toxin [Aquibium microcysteis]|uniref:type II toxin-antitoxin system RelE/ParE family toxin n=1 Tax=Aquibium microcysteis TaxID=675281 RepID=UPI00165D2568|nr:type II toxin-antitoxin system RelE/ParE family toxin [Aquibium microcysteis]